jgi:hypothetical protein
MPKKPRRVWNADDPEIKEALRGLEHLEQPTEHLEQPTLGISKTKAISVIVAAFLLGLVLLPYSHPHNPNDRFLLPLALPAIAVFAWVFYQIDKAEGFRTLKAFATLAVMLAVFSLIMLNVDKVIQFLDSFRLVPPAVLLAIPYLYAVYLYRLINRYCVTRKDRRNGLLGVMVIVALISMEVWYFLNYPTTPLYYHLMVAADCLFLVFMIVIEAEKFIQRFSTPPLHAKIRVRLSSGKEGWVDPDKFDPDIMEKI